MVKANAFADEFNECIKNDFMIPRRTGISYSTDYRLRSGKLCLVCLSKRGGKTFGIIRL